MNKNSDSPRSITTQDDPKEPKIVIKYALLVRKSDSKILIKKSTFKKKKKKEVKRVIRKLFDTNLQPGQKKKIVSPKNGSWIAECDRSHILHICLINHDTQESEAFEFIRQSSQRLSMSGIGLEGIKPKEFQSLYKAIFSKILADFNKNDTSKGGKNKRKSLTLITERDSEMETTKKTIFNDTNLISAHDEEDSEDASKDDIYDDLKIGRSSTATGDNFKSIEHDSDELGMGFARVNSDRVKDAVELHGSPLRLKHKYSGEKMNKKKGRVDSGFVGGSGVKRSMNKNDFNSESLSGTMISDGDLDVSSKTILGAIFLFFVLFFRNFIFFVNSLSNFLERN